MLKTLVFTLSILFFTACNNVTPTPNSNEKDIKKEDTNTTNTDKMICPPAPVKIVEKVVIKIKEVPEKRSKMVIGRVENVHIPFSDIVLKARIDTGATTTSIHAQDIKPFERDGEKWVKFKLVDTSGKILDRVLPVHRVIKVKRDANMEPQRRYVVKMKLRIGSFDQVVDVSLNDRSNLNYSVLIGRNYLKGWFLVDVSKKFLADTKKN